LTKQGWRLSSKEWNAWVESLLQSGRRVIAPADLGNSLRLFQPVFSTDAIAVDDYDNTRWSPKEYLFPSTETMFSYRYEGDKVHLEGPASDSQGQVLLGVRPCDAAGMSRLDDVFLGDSAEIKDPFHADRRNRTTVISLGCSSAQSQCFCPAVGGSPLGTDGSDIQLVQIDDNWLLSPITPKGEELMAGATGEWTVATDEDWATVDEIRIAVESSIKGNVVPLEWASALEETFSDDVWKSLGERCLSCGICAYVCPSCSCFDMSDDGNAYCGERCRVWDSCTFAQFTKHSTGHNPRKDQPERYRQRVMHKFAYFPLEQGDNFMCVGCGRCTALCPVGLDIRSSVQTAVGSAVPAGDGS
jgi:ferredoxin